MKAIVRTLLLVVAIASLTGCKARSDETKLTSLCVAQQRASEGSHEAIAVTAIFSEGFDRGTIQDPACPKESVWAELDLRSDENREELRRMIEHSRRARVTVEGELYGPPLPDPKLPQSIRRSYHPGWGHLGAFRTKLVIHTIREVKEAPSLELSKP